MKEYEPHPNQEFWSNPECSTEEYWSPMEASESGKLMSGLLRDFPEIEVKHGVEINLKTGEFHNVNRGTDDALRPEENHFRADKSTQTSEEEENVDRMFGDFLRLLLRQLTDEVSREQKKFQREMLIRVKSKCVKSKFHPLLEISVQPRHSERETPEERAYTISTGISDRKLCLSQMSGASEKIGYPQRAFPSFEAEIFDRRPEGSSETGRLPSSPMASSLKLSSCSPNSCLSTKMEYSPHHVGKTNLNHMGKKRHRWPIGDPLTLHPSELQSQLSLSLQEYVSNSSFGVQRSFMNEIEGMPAGVSTRSTSSMDHTSMDNTDNLSLCSRSTDDSTMGQQSSTDSSTVGSGDSSASYSDTETFKGSEETANGDSATYWTIENESEKSPLSPRVEKIPDLGTESEGIETCICRNNDGENTLSSTSESLSLEVPSSSRVLEKVNTKGLKLWHLISDTTRKSEEQSRNEECEISFSTKGTHYNTH